MQRADDTEEALGQRSKGYHAPDSSHSRTPEPTGVVTKIDANQAPPIVWTCIDAGAKGQAAARFRASRRTR